MNRNVSILYPEWENSLKIMTTDDHCYFPSRTTLTSLKGGAQRTWCHLEDFCNLLRLEATSSLSSSASKRQDIRCNVCLIAFDMRSCCYQWSQCLAVTSCVTSQTRHPTWRSRCRTWPVRDLSSSFTWRGCTGPGGVFVLLSLQQRKPRRLPVI